MKIITGFASIIMFYASGISAGMIYTDRITYESQLGTIFTDDFSKTVYTNVINTDAAMSAVRGETRYQSTGFSNLNVVFADGVYCAGCNGSFLLDFTSTSVDNGDGVYGVGLDIPSFIDVLNTTAFVTFGDGRLQNYSLPDANSITGDQFWGLTDAQLISSIHFGLPFGGTNTDRNVQRMAMDNLTIGSKAENVIVQVPEPGSIALLAIAFIGLSCLRRPMFRRADSPASL